MTNTRDSASPIDAVDEELIDTLIAISVVAKRLAAMNTAADDFNDN